MTSCRTENRTAGELPGQPEYTFMKTDNSYKVVSLIERSGQVLWSQIKDQIH